MVHRTKRAEVPGMIEDVTQVLLSWWSSSSPEDWGRRQLAPN